MVKLNRLTSRVVIGLLFLGLVAFSGSYAQFMQGPRIVSPEIHPDNTVTFRIMAPLASEVSVRGEWMAGFGAGEALTPSDSGLWSVTLGPLAPEFYGYTFLVDSVQVLDPLNAIIKRDGTRNANVLLVPGEASDLYAVQDVPHGTLSKVWYTSPTLELTRRMYVYTPPGYENSDERYPVFYLLHGGGGDEDAWTTLGRAPQILDNLIAQGKAKPMIVVMTNGNANQTASITDRPTQTEAAPNPGPFNIEDEQAVINSNKQFPNSLVNDVIPYVEKHFRVIANSANRAIAGLSMGSLQTQITSMTHPELFQYIGCFSLGIHFNDQFAILSNQILIPAYDSELKTMKNQLFYIGCGTEDFCYEGVQTLREKLDEHDFEYIYNETGGGHTWANWRIYLSEYATLLFQ